MADTAAYPTAADAVTIADGLRFPEGPVALDDGSVLIVQLAAEVVSRVDPDGTVTTVAEVPGGPNGAALAGDALLVCNNGGFFTFTEMEGVVIPSHGAERWSGGSIDRIDLATGEVTTLYTHCGDERLLAPNDLVLDGHGGFWFTDHGVRQEEEAHAGQAGLYHARVDGSGVSAVVRGLDAPNGVGLSPDGDLVHVAETYTGRVWSWPVPSPGTVGRHPQAAPDAPRDHGGRLLFDAPEGHLFDSLGVDGDGFVVVGTLGLGAGGLTVVDPESGEATHLPMADPLVTNVCFGGEGRRTAFCTGSGLGSLFRLPWPRPGLALPT